MSEAKKEVKKPTKESAKVEKPKMTKNEVYTFNEVWSGWKVGRISNAGIRDYFHLKEKVTKHAREFVEEIQAAQKTVISEMGFKEGDEIPTEKQVEIKKIVDDIAEKIGKEEIELDTHILSEEDVLNGLINSGLNDNYDTHQKYVMIVSLSKRKEDQSDKPAE